MSDQEVNVDESTDEKVSKFEAMRLLSCSESRLRQIRDKGLIRFSTFKRRYSYVLSDIKKIAAMDAVQVNLALQSERPVVPKKLKDHRIIPPDMIDTFDAVGLPLDINSITVDQFVQRHYHTDKISGIIAKFLFGDLSITNAEDRVDNLDLRSIYYQLKREELTVTPIDPDEWMPYVCELPERTLRYEVGDLGDLDRVLEALGDNGDLHRNGGCISFEFVDKFFGRSWHTYRIKAVVKINGVVFAVRVRYNEKFAANDHGEYGYGYDSRKAAYSFISVRSKQGLFTKESVASMEEHGVIKKARAFMLLNSVVEDGMLERRTSIPQHHRDYRYENLEADDMKQALQRMELMSSHLREEEIALRRAMRK